MIAAGQTAVAVAAEAVAPGPDGNGFLAGQVDSLVAPLPGVTVAVANVTATAGGAAVEDDERLRRRIRAAPRAFSVAGPEGAYAWWAMTAHQDIVDVAVLSPAPAEVEVYLLMRGGLPEAEMLALVAAAVSDQTRRPLADRVTVLAPVRVAYAIEVAVTVYRTADPVAVQAAVTARLAALAAAWRARLGVDIVPSQIVAAAQAVAGVYQVALVQPAWRAVAPSEWADCTALTATVAGVADG